ncbi:MAG: DUF4276 family protein [Rhodoferax sp.]|nr:DUF4276 family protein [Rhodoferax sp.]
MSNAPIGMIFECGPMGADKQVCEYLAKQLYPGVQISSATLDNKKNLLESAAAVTKRLLKDGCCGVLIIWDLRPAWPDKQKKPCRAAERNHILSSLRQAGVPSTAPVYLVCIEQELESWLLACDHAISAHLSTSAHAYKVERCKQPDQVPQPKAVMEKHFSTARGWVYRDLSDALRVLQAANLDEKRLCQSTSFERFKNKLAAFV